MRQSFITLACFFLFGSSVCSHVSAQSSTGFTLSGTLVHDVSDTPIEGANISILDGDRAVTDSHGGFRLKIPAAAKPGDDIQILIFHPAEYGFHRRTHRMNAVKTQDAGQIRINRKSNIGVVGIVKDGKTKKLVEGLTVSVSSTNLAGTTIEAKKTNAFGAFSFVIPKVAFASKTDYVDLLIQDPLGRYRDYTKTVNILASIEILLDNQVFKVKRKTVEISGRKSVEIEVEEGSIVKISASGNIKVGNFVGSSAPDGLSSGVFGVSLSAYNLVPEFKHAVLMYGLPGDTKWRSCGLGCQFIAQTSGKMEIQFEINDNSQGDNVGAYDVEIGVE